MSQKLLYHHCTDLDSIIHGELKANPKYSEPFFRDASFWLEREVGFYPLFLAVGATEEDIRMTGYQNNWRVRTSSWLEDGKPQGTYRKKGEFPNYVLFSFEEINGVFTDYDCWHFVLNAGCEDYQMTDYEKRRIFKPSWTISKWIKRAKKNAHSVQLVTQCLYLPDAKRIWVRNKSTREKLEEMGFENVKVKRIILNDY